jgi:hypothetical protein
MIMEYWRHSLFQVELNKECKLDVTILDADDAPFARADVELMQLVVSVSNQHATVIRYYRVFTFTFSHLHSCKGEGSVVLGLCVNFHLFSDDLLSYRIRGLKVGTYSFQATATAADGRIVKALPHRVQIFAALSLQPRFITLIPESVFQVRRWHSASHS